MKTICIVLAVLLCAQAAVHSPTVTTDHPVYDATAYTNPDYVASALHDFTARLTTSEIKVVSAEVYHIHLGDKIVEYSANITLQPAEQEIENILNVTLILRVSGRSQGLSGGDMSGLTVVKANPSYTVPYVITFHNVTATDRLSLISTTNSNVGQVMAVAGKQLTSYIHESVTQDPSNVLSTKLADVTIEEHQQHYRVNYEVDVPSRKSIYLITVYVTISDPSAGKAPESSAHVMRVKQY